MLSRYTPKQLSELHALWRVQLFFLACLFLSMYVGPIFMTIVWIVALRSTTTVYLQRQQQASE